MNIEIRRQNSMVTLVYMTLNKENHFQKEAIIAEFREIILREKPRTNLQNLVLDLMGLNTVFFQIHLIFG